MTWCCPRAVRGAGGSRARPKAEAAGTQHRECGRTSPKPPWAPEWAVPAGVEVAQGEGHVAAHGDDDGPLAAELLDEERREEHGGQEHPAIEGAERRHPQALLAVQAALWGQGQPGQKHPVRGPPGMGVQEAG